MVSAHAPGDGTCIGPKRAKLLDGQKVVANLLGVLDSLSDPVRFWEDAPTWF
jgi:hypothetical protein